jgi:beta-glucosidase
VGRTQFIWETKINSTDKTGFDEAIANAKQFVVVLGEHGLQSGGRSRTEDRFTRCTARITGSSV